MKYVCASPFALSPLAHQSQFTSFFDWFLTSYSVNSKPRSTAAESFGRNPRNLGPDTHTHPLSRLQGAPSSRRSGCSKGTVAGQHRMQRTTGGSTRRAGRQPMQHRRHMLYCRLCGCMYSLNSKGQDLTAAAAVAASSRRHCCRTIAAAVASSRRTSTPRGQSSSSGGGCSSSSSIRTACTAPTTPGTWPGADTQPCSRPSSLNPRGAAARNARPQNPCTQALKPWCPLSSRPC